MTQATPNMSFEVEGIKLNWPTEIRCHSVATTEDLSAVWRKRDGSEYRTCSFCGGVHPEDLLNILRIEGIRLGGADWKYGWPHKFYIHTPDGNEELRKKIPWKFYNDHLYDFGYPEHKDAMNVLCEVIERLTKIKFYYDIEDSKLKLKFMAPHDGYQA